MSETPPPTPPAAEPLLELALSELRARRQALLDEIVQLEAQREQINQELKASFSGQSDQIARRLKGFQDYLVGALQDLTVAAEQIELVPQPLLVQPSPLDQAAAAASADSASLLPPAAASSSWMTTNICYRRWSIT
jgi:hypothetical protein